MQILNIGPLELIIVLLIMFLLLGPREMILMAQRIGKWIRSFVRSPMWKEIMGYSQEIRELPQKLMDDTGLRETLDEIKTSTTQTTQELNQTVQEAVKEARVPEAENIRIQTNPTSVPTARPKVTPAKPAQPPEEPPAEEAAPATLETALPPGNETEVPEDHALDIVYQNPQQAVEGTAVVVAEDAPKHRGRPKKIVAAVEQPDEPPASRTRRTRKAAPAAEAPSVLADSTAQDAAAASQETAGAVTAQPEDQPVSGAVLVPPEAALADVPQTQPVERKPRARKPKTEPAAADPAALQPAPIEPEQPPVQPKPRKRSKLPASAEPAPSAPVMTGPVEPSIIVPADTVPGTNGTEPAKAKPRKPRKSAPTRGAAVYDAPEPSGTDGAPASTETDGG